MTLHEAIDRFTTAWNRHDAEALASMWTADGELHHPWGYRRVGREAIRELLRDEHAAAMAGSTLNVQRIVTDGDERRASAEIDAVLTGVQAPNGRKYDLPHVMSALFVRTGDAWEIRTMAPMARR